MDRLHPRGGLDSVAPDNGLRGRMVGKTALDFTLLDHRGTLRSLSDYQGQWLLMVFHRHLG